MKTDDKLKTLFSYQDFIKDSDLINMKREVEKSDCRILSDDELEHASGGMIPPLIIGQVVTISTLDGKTKTGIVSDFNADRILVDSVGWVNKDDIK